MRIIVRKTLKEFWESGNAGAEQPLKSWFNIASKAIWNTPEDIKSVFRSASFVMGNRVVFNIAGNKYRLVVKINYPYNIIYIRFIGTHKEYDKINVVEI